MKRILLIIIVFVSFLYGCGMKEKEVVKEPNDIDLKIIKTNEAVDIPNSSFDEKDLDRYLGMTMSEIIEETQEKVTNDYDTISIVESQLFFPYLFSEKLGITFVFLNQDEDKKPTCLIINEESNVKRINVLGAAPGTVFADINKILDATIVENTWIANKDNIVYMIEYETSNLVYKFISYDEIGTNSTLYVYKK